MTNGPDEALPPLEPEGDEAITSEGGEAPAEHDTVGEGPDDLDVAGGTED